MRPDRIVLLLCLSLAPPSVRAAQDAGLPGSYLNFAGGPQAMGMGRAFVGLAEGADALPYNPAGLARLRPNVLGFLHSRTIEEASLDYISYAQPLYRLGGLGLGYARMASGSLPMTDEFNREVGRFQDLQQTWMAGFGLGLLKGVSAGAAFKYSRQELAGASASGWGLDLGFLGQVRQALRLGLRLKNLVPPVFRYESGEDRFPRSATLGASARLFRDRLALTFDTEKTLDAPQALQARLGAEAALFGVLRLRGGADLAAQEFTFGMGTVWGRYGLDYASASGRTGASHRFGMSYSWGGYPVSVFAKPQTFSPVGLRKSTMLSIQVDERRLVYSWELLIRNQSGDLIRSIRGNGRPPGVLEWDGTTELGMMVAAGNYSYVLAVTDKEGRTEITPARVVRVEYKTPLDALELQAQ